MESDRAREVMQRLNAPPDLFALTPGGGLSKRPAYIRLRARVWWELRKQCPVTGHWLSLTKIANATTGRSHVSVLQALRLWGPVFEAEERAASGHGPLAVSINEDRTQAMITRTAITNAKMKREYARERLDEALAYLGYTEEIFGSGKHGQLLRDDWMVEARRQVYLRMMEPLDGPPVKMAQVDKCIGLSSSTTRTALNRPARPQVVMPVDIIAERDRVLAARGLTMDVFAVDRGHTADRNAVLATLREYAPRGRRVSIKTLARCTVGVGSVNMVVYACAQHAVRMATRKAAA